MAKSNIVIRKPGRPPTGATPVVSVRLPTSVVAGIDALAKNAGKSRTDVMREILEQALAAQPKAKAKR